MEKETPNKIYLYPSRLKKGKILGRWFMTRYNQDSVEYIRTDAFIEKACEFISLNVADYVDVTHKGGIEHLALQERFIENFKKYMKGE